MYDSYREIIDAWPSRGALSEALGNVTRDQVLKWWQRDFIPCENWRRLVRVSRGQRRVTYDNLAELAARRLELKEAA